MSTSSRRDLLRPLMLEAGLDALLVTTPTNTRYLTGFTGSNGATLVSLDPRADRLATDFRYLTQVQTECPDVEALIERSVVEALAAHAVATGIGRLGIEASHLTVAAHAAIAAEHRDLELVPTSGLVEGLRSVKDDEELDHLATACRLSDVALAALLPEIRVGLTERAISRRLEWLMLESGAEAISFETIVAGGPHSAIPHHTPTDRPLEAGDLLKIDFGAAHAGYHADETRTFVVGAPAQDWQREIHELVGDAQRAGVRALGVGVDVRDVDHAARSVIAAAGYAEQFGHGLGHGVGLDIHEAPMIGYSATGILGDRTPVTVEPGVYLPGRGGVRIEDTLVVRTGGPVSLTQTTRELLVLG